MLVRTRLSLVTHVQRRPSPNARNSGYAGRLFLTRTTSGGRLQIFEAELKKVEDLNRVKEYHEKFGMAMEKRLVEAEAGMQAATAQANTCRTYSSSTFRRSGGALQDAKYACSKVHIHFSPFFQFTFLTFCLSRTEYKDDIESIFENLDISSHLPVSSLHMSIYATSPMLIYSPPILLRLPLVQK